jgi:hypothetical protein
MTGVAGVVHCRIHRLRTIAASAVALCLVVAPCACDIQVYEGRLLPLGPFLDAAQYTPVPSPADDASQEDAFAPVLDASQEDAFGPVLLDAFQEPDDAAASPEDASLPEDAFSPDAEAPLDATQPVLDAGASP